jgi:diguanylate cyclase (GGDEF)-like protein
MSGGRRVLPGAAGDGRDRVVGTREGALVPVPRTGPQAGGPTPGNPSGGSGVEGVELDDSVEATVILRRRAVDLPSLVVVRALLGSGPFQCWTALPGSQGVLGRSPDADIVISDPSVSRYHARIDVDAEGALIVSDLGSTNGTFVNLIPVAPRSRLRVGDRLTVGGVPVSVEAMSAAEVDQLRRAALRLDAADRDSLTGLVARRWIDEDLPAYLQRHTRVGGLVSCLFLDLDGFKEVNDRYGHATGDRVLRAIGDIVRRVVRDDDVAVRFGGDEMVVFLARCDASEAARVADRMRAAVAKLSEGGVAAGSVTLSAGVAEYRAGEDPSGWVERADGALYRAKRAGKDQTVQAD